jgi:hypothetical protein
LIRGFYVFTDPYGDIADGLKLAVYIGQSKVVGGTTTDMIAYVSDSVFVQAWIGTGDKLPRMLRAVYRTDPAQLRHQMELSCAAMRPSSRRPAQMASTTASCPLFETSGHP